MEDVRKMSEKKQLQDVLYRLACNILSAEELHVLRHVLRAERIGPLMANEFNMLNQLLGYTGADPLSPSERQLFISLLRKRASGAVINSDEEVTLRTLLLQALASSLSSEQHRNASYSLQKKETPRISPIYLDDLYRTLNGPDHQQGRNTVQAALEEQLASCCGWPQQMAIHRLLFLEPPWPLSPEERQFLEALYVQPAVWWSPAQENRFFTSLAEGRGEGAVDPPDEALQLLLQLLAASLTPLQRQHLAALLGEPNVQLTAQQPPTLLSRKHEVAPMPGQVRTMALLQRVLEGERLTPVENGFLQDGILRELWQLLPPEDAQALYSVVLSSDPISVPRSSVPVLQELQRARELWEAGGDLATCVEQAGGSGCRQMFMYCLAMSLNTQQLKGLAQLLREHSEEQKPDKEQQVSQGSSARTQWVSCHSNSPFHGDGDPVGYRVAEEPKEGCTGENDDYSAIQEAGARPAELQTDSVKVLTQGQVDILKLLLELHNLGCNASQQEDLLADLLSRFKFSGPISDQQLQLVHQLVLLQFSTSFSEAQVELIGRIISAVQCAPHQTGARNSAQIDCAPALATGDETMPRACQYHSELITPSQRRLLQWFISRRFSHDPASVQRPLCSQHMTPFIMNGDTPVEPYVTVPYQPLLQLASSLSEAQVEMLLLFLDGVLGEPAGTDSEGAGKNANVTALESEASKNGLSGAKQIVTPTSPRLQTQHFITVCPSIPTGAVTHEEKPAYCTTLQRRKRDPVEALPNFSSGFRDENFSGASPCESAEIGNSQEGGLHCPRDSALALSPLDASDSGQSEVGKDGQPSARTDLDVAVDCDAPPQSEHVGNQEQPSRELQMNEKIAAGVPVSYLYHEQLPSPRTCSSEELARKKKMLQQLILDATDQRIFLEDLKIWRQQYNLRAKLREVLNPYILKIQTLQQGYLKRCPCLYHQQQDQREEEERQANLRLLDSLGSSIWGTGDQNPRQLGSSSFQGPSGLSSEEFQGIGSEDFGTLSHGDSASSGVLPLAMAFRQTTNTQVGRTSSNDRYSSPRQQSAASLSECYSLEREVSKSSAGSGGRHSSASPVAKAPSHCSSLGSALLLGSGEGQTPVSSPTRLRSPVGSRAERHQRGVGRDESVWRGDLDVSVEDRKKIMQRQALEKAERVKEDARVAFLVVFMKRMQPGSPAFGSELIDRINLSHLNSKTLPKGRRWKTQGLLRMIEGIVSLVFTSILQPLLALASQTRAEDIDLAIHAELEGVRRAVLGLPGGGSTSPEKGQRGDGQAEGKRRSKDVSTGSAAAAAEEEDTKITSTDAAPPPGRVTQETPREDAKKSRPKAELATDCCFPLLRKCKFEDSLRRHSGRNDAKAIAFRDWKKSEPGGGEAKPEQVLSVAATGQRFEMGCRCADGGPAADAGNYAVAEGNAEFEAEFPHCGRVDTCGAPRAAERRWSTAREGNFRWQPTRQFGEGPQIPNLPRERLSPDEDSFEHANAHGSRSAAASGVLAVRSDDESRAVTSSAPPLSSLDGFTMGRSSQGLSNPGVPSGGCQTARQLPDLEERRTPLQSQQTGGVDSGILGFFGRPIWYSDSAADRSTSVEPEGSHRYTGSCDVGVSKIPFPTALFVHVAMFLGAEDVVALASVCKSLRWIAFHRDTWKSLCFSSGVVSYSRLSTMPHQPGTRIAGNFFSDAKPPHLAQPDHEPHLCKGPQQRGNISDGCLGLESNICSSLFLQDWPPCTGLLRKSGHSDSSSRPSDFGCRCGVGSSDGAFPCEGAAVCRRGFSKSGIYPPTAAATAWEAGTHCRGLQFLAECTRKSVAAASLENVAHDGVGGTPNCFVPGGAKVLLAFIFCECAVHELVDWRFLFLLNRASPGPRIHVHVRELELQFPMYPVIPDMTNTRRCSTAGGSPTCDGQECGGGEQEKQRQSKCNARNRWLGSQEFVSTFVRRALNICQPMRLRQLRPGNRPGLCVAELLREQHYLLEWQVPLRCLQEPSLHSSCFVAGGESNSTAVWPLPPYGSQELDSLAQLGSNWRRQERTTVHNVIDENSPRRSRQAPEVDAVHDDRLIFDVLDRGGVFASLLSPLSVGTTAAAIFVGAVLVAVATSSATAAITTAAAATATLAARRSRLFRVDLHVLERDEHEEDQEEEAECDIPQSRLVSSFPGYRGLATGPLAAGGYSSLAQIESEATPSGPGPPTSCGPASTGAGGHVGGQGGACVSGSLGSRLPLLGRLVQERIARLVRSSTLASAALTKTSRALACTILTSVSRDTMTTASAVLAAAGTVLTSLLRPPGSRRCRLTSNAQSRENPTYMRTAQKQRLPQGGFQLTASSGLSPDVEVEETCAGKPLDSPVPTKTMRLFRRLPTQNRGNPEQLQGKEGIRELRRRGGSGDSAFFRSRPAAPLRLRRSKSFLSVCIGHFEALHRRSCCSMPARFPRSSDPCDIYGESTGSGSVAHRMRALSTGATILQHPERHVRRSLWRSTSSMSESNSRETEREDTSSSDQEHSRGREMNGPDAAWTPTRELPEQNSGLSSSGWSLESPPLQPGHGLLLFVRTSLPPSTVLYRSRGSMKGYSLGTSEWDAATATPFSSLPEDVPLLLPTDATVTDLVRLLFLTLAERKYVLPLISATPLGESLSSNGHLDGITDRPHCRRRRDKSSQTVHSSRVYMLRFWLASTHPNREHLVEQPSPSAKLAADLRLTSCERLNLAVMPFSLARRAAPAGSGCLTLTCAPRGPPTQKPGHVRGNSTGAQSGTTLPSCSSQEYPSEDKMLSNEASPWLLSPLSTWTQDKTLSVETGTPAEGEPTLVLCREAALEPLCRTAGSSDGCSQGQSCLQAASLLEGILPHSCTINSDHHASNVLRNAASVYLLLDTSDHTEATNRTTAPQVTQQGQHAKTLCSSADFTTSADTSAQRPVGIMVEEEDARPCKPWILQSSVNARQFEYHPGKSNVLLTGNNDGRVRVLDWKRDVVLGTELVDSHPILALSWLKHNPELFVCAAGVSGIPYVVRWREQDDIFVNEVKGDRGRILRASVVQAQPSVPLSTQSRGPAQQQQQMEVGDHELNHDDQYSGDRDEYPDGSTMAAALTWFRRCGRGERLSREGTASLRIVHQYCACEDLSSVSVNSTDDYLLVSGRSADLTIHDVATGARLGTLSGLHSDSINIVRFAHSSPHLFVTASFDQTCRLWDLRQRISGHQPLLTVDTGSLSVMCCFDDSDEWLLCSGVDAALRQVCLRSATVFPESFAIPPVNAETNFRRAVYLQGGREFITAGTEEGFFRVFSRLGRDLGLVSLEGLLRPFIRVRSSQGLATLADLQAELLNLRIYLRSHMALGFSAMSDAALATAAGVSRSSVAAVLRTALRHLSGGSTGLLDMEVLDRMWQAVNGPGSPWFFIWQQGMRSEPSLFQDAGTGTPENNVVEEYVQSLRAHPQERRLVGALLATKDQVETVNGEASYVAMSWLPATMLG
ncbi:WD domain, G-beta repeat-containing protein, putative [Eimeria brunetti]|uniref:WD domain, G-beta repeat-containing protein, putative n=1 Tax=Eimeria brunetti TaxID=51314 RepID=U6LL63_9EIME|nr:WD domain, G-beta repeat-containing protein, putative [Eimeria brunetti]